MFFRSHPIRPLLASLLWCGWVAGAPLATASESHDAPAGAPSIKRPVLAVKAGKEAAPTKAEAPADGKLKLAVAKEAAQDPLDKLRERLAEKLGAVKVPEAGSPNVLRVAARASEPAAPGADPARRPAARGAAVAPSKGAGKGELPHWSYEGGQAGPESWGRLQAEFSKCSVGTRQSPIDIRDGIKVQLDPVLFDYRPSSFRVVDNGHTVQVNVGTGNSIEVLGRRYELVQFHFHRPSEERINGRQFDMVVHMVHKDLDGRLAVVAVLLERGGSQPVLQQVWNNLPLEKGEEVPAKTPLDLNALLPSERSYYTYMGSLTTPPCSEGVLWMVMKNPVPVSADQIGIFARLYPMNARPVQSAAGRLIKESN